MTAVPAPFRFDITPDRQRVLVTPVGELDLATVPEVERGIDDLLARGFAHIVVDLRGVTFLDSSGIRLLLVARQHAEQAGVRLSLILGGPGVCRPLELAGVLEMFEVLRR